MVSVMADIQLPNFEGNSVDAVALSFTGTIKDESLQPQRALRLGQIVSMFGIGEVVGVNHKADKDGNVTRIHTVQFVEAHEIPASEADTILDSLRQDSPTTPGETEAA